ncbi:MAG: helix-turn-helix domain-containing protein [Clostridia bacterium]|nr:helix-turn-helix domain-containing protein [Clostridia bacterium]
MPVRVQIENFGDEKSVRFQHLNERYHYTMHMHQFVELFVSLNGSLEITVDDRCETINPGQAALVLSYQPHMYDSAVRNEVAIFVFSTTLLPEFSSSYVGMISDKSVFTLSKSTLFAIKEKIIDAKSYDIYDLKGVLYLATQDFLNQVKMIPAPKKHNMPASIINYVREHLCDDISLEKIASKLGYSPKYLSNRISHLFDMNFPRLVANIRVDKARHLLRETDKSRAEICYECGFGSERSFHRQFREIMNYSPQEYRNLGLGRIRQGKLKTFK